ncbi:MAG: hypothetical protein ACM336_03285 [Acidobacteriota bacterium]
MRFDNSIACSRGNELYRRVGRPTAGISGSFQIVASAISHTFEVPDGDGKQDQLLIHNCGRPIWVVTGNNPSIETSVGTGTLIHDKGWELFPLAGFVAIIADPNEPDLPPEPFPMAVVTLAVGRGLLIAEEGE